MGTPLPSTWDPAVQEPALYQRWIDAGYFTADPGADRPAYSIVMAPPNVTGSLHMGHALEHTVMDALTRRRRMQGYEVLWLPGMDHAGIATQNVVERELAKEDLTRHDLGRTAFVDRVWRWKAEYGGKILGQMRRLGDGVDWTRERFTMDSGLSRAVHTMFKRLFDDGLIYRAERIINWCPRCTTALSDIEVDHADTDGELVSIRYGDGETSIVVATTRAETMLGDTAVAVHPDDARYRHLVGTEVELPLSGRRIPIVADPAVDPAFGTGAVKVTPAHDPADFEIGRRHGLAAPTILDERAAISAPGQFHGLDRLEARAAVVEELRRQRRITAEEPSYRHAVGHCSRCQTVVEPRLSLQWWVRVESLAEAASAAVRAGRTRIHPPEQEKRFFDWVDNLHDWTISRQLWWGHQIPVWYGPDGEVVCLGPDDDPPSGDGWRQDPDVLDTWFSSGLWPLSTLGWPDDTADLRRFFPTSVLSTGYDILFFWVVRMMLLGLYATGGTPPFPDVYLHGLIRDAAGRKMSKSSGNVIDPLEWLDRYGADALRFTLARGANPGADLVADEQWADGSRKFCIKLWNAGRFALAHGADPGGPLPAREGLTDADRWILDRTDALVSEVDELFESFQLGRLRETLYHFVWDEFCNWYLELAKVQLAAGGSVAGSTRAVLGRVLDVTLRLLHPLLPFVTEALWTSLTGGESLVVAEWPHGGREEADQDAARRIAGLRAVVTEIRRFRAEHAVNAGQRVGARLSGMDSAGLSGLEPQLAALARLDLDPDQFAPSGSVRVGLPDGSVSVDLDLSAAVDPATERARRDRQLASAERELAGTSAKLANADFLRKAPAEVVAAIRTRHAAALEELKSDPGV